MKTLRLLIVLVVAIFAINIMNFSAMALDTAANGDAPVTVVGEVDLQRYAGIWYEIMKIPNRFQKKCMYGTTAEYALSQDGSITVVNRCFKKDGSVAEARGVAKIVDTTSNAELKVSFVSFFGWRPFWGDYWIIGLDESYDWAIIGTPDRKYGWVLARTPELDEETTGEILNIIERQGYEREAFEPSRQ